MRRFRLTLPPFKLEQLREWLQPALDVANNAHDFDHVMQAVERGEFQLWVGDEGAAITQVVDFPNRRVLHVLYAGGKMQQIKDFQASAAAWAQQLGCASLTLSGRLGWQRALAKEGWKPREIVMEYPICQADFSEAQRAKAQSQVG